MKQTRLQKEIVKVHEEIKRTSTVNIRKMEELKARRRVLERYQEIWEEKMRRDGQAA